MSSSGGHGLGRTRAQILQVLLSSSEPATVNSLAEHLGLHPNSARFHLDGLVEAGYATKTPETHGRGRPRLVYRATPDAPDVTNQHLRQLVTVLVDEIIAHLPDPMSVAEQAGYRWGMESAPQPTKHPIAALIDHANELGFVASADDQGRLTFSRCPYRVSGDPSASPICAVHLGMIRGFLDSADAGVSLSEVTRDGDTCSALLSATCNGECAG